MKHFILDDFLNNLCTVPDEVFSVEEEVLNALELAAENLNNTYKRTMFVIYRLSICGKQLKNRVDSYAIQIRVLLRSFFNHGTFKYKNRNEYQCS